MENKESKIDNHKEQWQKEMIEDFATGKAAKAINALHDSAKIKIGNNIGREGLVDDTKPMPWEKVPNKEVNNELEMQEDNTGFYNRISKNKEQKNSTVSSVSMDSFKKKVAEIKQGLPQNQPLEKKKSSISIGM